MQSPEDGEALLKLLGSAHALATDKPNPTARVRMQIRLDNGRAARAEVVILVMQNEDEPFRVLSWRDDSDGSF
jgi:general secretion pathway protein K